MKTSLLLVVAALLSASSLAHGSAASNHPPSPHDDPSSPHYDPSWPQYDPTWPRDYPSPPHYDPPAPRDYPSSPHYDYRLFADEERESESVAPGDSGESRLVAYGVFSATGLAGGNQCNCVNRGAAATANFWTFMKRHVVEPSQAPNTKANWLKLLRRRRPVNCPMCNTFIHIRRNRVVPTFRDGVKDNNGHNLYWSRNKLKVTNVFKGNRTVCTNNLFVEVAINNRGQPVHLERTRR